MSHGITCPQGYYLRLSITDACGYRCAYCQPDGPVTRGARDLLDPDAIETLVRALAEVGVHRVRLTGGEPLLRSECVEIVRRLAAIEAITEVCLTTNGRRLSRLAAPLAEAGLTRLNVHLDTLDPERHRRLMGHDDHALVLAGLDAAEAAGLPPPKLNVVVMRGLNDDEIPAFCTHAIETGRTVRFIEVMDTGVAAEWARARRVSAAEIRDRIAAAFDLTPRFASRGASPAQEYLLDGGAGVVGIIASETEPFCDRCNRLRLSARGVLSGCLYQAGGVALAPLLHQPEVLRTTIARAIGDKRSFHPVLGEGPGGAFSMAVIGG